MATVSLQKAQAELGELLIRAEAGEEIVIERDSMPALRLRVATAGGNGSPARTDTAEGGERPIRGYGSFAHLRGKIPDAFFFDALPEEELKLWEGGD